MLTIEPGKQRHCVFVTVFSGFYKVFSVDFMCQITVYGDLCIVFRFADKQVGIGYHRGFAGVESAVVIIIAAVRILHIGIRTDAGPGFFIGPVYERD